MITKKRLLKIKEEVEYDEDFDGWGDINEPIIVDGVSLKTEEVEGGYEGSGEKYWVVLKIQEGEETSFWKIPGWYSSYAGSELEFRNAFEVESVEKVINVWEKKKKKK